ncbi:MAG TPA: uroporphyrinogen-III synthase [Trueperaceae bacterium]|nr:uroporphyrinogen-III synthase [Trueperaceae bacterium]
MRILLTQSEHALRGLEPALLGLGHEVVRWPLIRTVPLTDLGTRSQAGALAACRWLLFTSIASVEAWAGARQRGLMLSASGQAGSGQAGSVQTGRGGQLYGAVGPGTAAALRTVGITPTLVAGGDASSLAAEFLAHPRARSPIGLPLGDRASSTLRATLERSGHDVVTAILYRTETLAPPDLAAPDTAPDVVVLASPSAVSALPNDIAPATIFVAIGNTTATAVRAGGRRCRQAAAPTVAGVVECLEAAPEPLMESDA